MGVLEKFRSGWRFRSKTPSFEPGAKVTAWVTSSDGDSSTVRIGDSILRLDESVAADTRIELRVLSFDQDTNEGTAECLREIETASF